MKNHVAAVVVVFFISSFVYATDTPCVVKAAEKKLAVAARNSFIKKCEKDASVALPASDCDAKAGERKLHGAARSSFVKKCQKDASDGK